MSPLPETIPAVSVVIPTYRREQLIEETLASVFGQSFRDFEVIVVNDGSPDATRARLQPLADAGRIRYFEQPNSGLSAARNRGIDLARGEFVMLLDDDDLLPPDKLLWQVELLRQCPQAVLCYGYGESFGLAQNYRVPATAGPHGRVHNEVLGGNPILSPGQVLLRTEVVRKLGKFDLSLAKVEDWDMWIRLSAVGEFVYEHRCSLHYRIHGDNMSQNTDGMFACGLQVLHKHLGRTPFNRRWRLWLQARSYIGRFTSVVAMGQCAAHARIGKKFAACLWMLKSIRYYPVLLGTRRFWQAWLRLVKWSPSG